MFSDDKEIKGNDHSVLNEEPEDLSLADPPEDPEDAAAPAPDSDQNTVEIEVEGLESDHSEPEEPEAPKVRSGGARRKGKRPKDEPGAGPTWKGEDRRRPSQKEVLSRLLEKNEVILQLTKKNVELERKVKELEDRRLRTAAEFENYRKRTRKEWELLKDQTKAEVLVEILDVVDDFERALAALGEREDDFERGIRLIYNNLTSILEGLGLEKMKSLGEPFDPNFHMAVAAIESKDAESNHIVEVIQEGYLMGGAVVRAAKVVIAE